MRIDILTLFPEMCEAFLGASIIGRARKKGIITIRCHQIRDYANDKHRRVDDTPYGGGKGMIMLAEPIARCFESICQEVGGQPTFVYMSPKGDVLNQEKVKVFSSLGSLAILCGHYEGVDERLIKTFVDYQVSIGDYVVSGGEMPAAILADSVSRLIPGVLSSKECFEDESHFNGVLEYPQYTKPAIWRGVHVPSVLLNGHHSNINEWRRKQSFLITKKVRPDLLKNCIPK
jgi:tRNA (guanine37-N1)-methyltransferase